MVILDWLVPRRRWAMGSGKENGPGSGWPAHPRCCGVWRLRIGEERCPWGGEGTPDLLLRGFPGRYVGVHVISLLFPHSLGCPGWELTGGGIEWIAHFLSILQNPDRLVEIIHSSADTRYDHATWYLNSPLGLLVVHDMIARWACSSSACLSIPSPVAETRNSFSLLSLSWKAAPQLHVTSPTVTSWMASDVDTFSWCVLLWNVEYLPQLWVYIHVAIYFSLSLIDCTDPEGRIHVDLALIYSTNTYRAPTRCRHWGWGFHSEHNRHISLFSGCLLPSGGMLIPYQLWLILEGARSCKEKQLMERGWGSGSQPGGALALLPANQTL